MSACRKRLVISEENVMSFIDRMLNIYSADYCEYDYECSVYYVLILKLCVVVSRVNLRRGTKQHETRTNYARHGNVEYLL